MARNRGCFKINLAAIPSERLQARTISTLLLRDISRALPSYASFLSRKPRRRLREREKRRRAPWPPWRVTAAGERGLSGVISRRSRWKISQRLVRLVATGRVQNTKAILFGKCQATDKKSCDMNHPAWVEKRGPGRIRNLIIEAWSPRGPYA